ncbi:o-succinylbenzoate--CoA ligase [Mycobacterium sp. OTB74]|uniref:o-succinylbenzoate--CoA ligase n=1 Tax=Mycobacterium sp. OTB74 TaxID=1853452 RepID=UPI0024733FE7|nr:o-succinylbenzoate--CoA ligase [Mycobacterium sp. OTB74]
MTPKLQRALEGSNALLPLPIDDERRAALLSSTLRVGEPIADDIAIVMATSGSTGSPKGALLSGSALAASAAATHDRLGGPGRWLLTLPTHHIAGLQVLVRSLYAGTTPVALPPDFEASELPSAVKNLGSGRRYASMVSVQLAKALADPAAAAALAELDAVLIGGGPIPPELNESALAAGVSVIRTYGMSETAGGCVYDGLPLDGVRLRLGDDGRIALGGPTLASGYRNPVDPSPFSDGWFLTDDIGAVDDSRTLQVLGRVDDTIATGGLKVLPVLVESALASHPSIAECGVFGVPDERLGQRVVVAVVLAPGAAAPTIAELRQHISLTLAATAAPREVHVVAELPRRGIGKLDRPALAARFGQS